MREEEKQQWVQFSQELSKKTPYVLFGAGDFLDEVLDFLEEKQYEKPLAICDNNKEKQGKVLRGIPVQSFEESLSLGFFHVLISSLLYHEEIHTQVAEKIPEKQIFKASNWYMKYELFCKRWVEKNRFSPERQTKDQETLFSHSISFTVILPITEGKTLESSISSVLQQNYKDLELILLVEEENTLHPLQEYPMKDPRASVISYTGSLVEGLNLGFSQAKGDYIGILNQGDLLHFSALYQLRTELERKKSLILYTDHLIFSEYWEQIEEVCLKPDFSPDTLHSFNYIENFTLFSKELWQQVGGFSSDYGDCYLYDILLKSIETSSEIAHVREMLYFQRKQEKNRESTHTWGKKVLKDHFTRCDVKATVADSKIPCTYHIQYELTEQPLISIMIPNKDHKSYLKRCIDSVLEKSTYENFEIIVIENNSTEQETFDYYKELEQHPKIQVVHWAYEFNYSKINNFGFTFTKGTQILLLNNDIEVITPNWLEEMLMLNQRQEVGATGVMLYFPNDTVQHAGVSLGVNKVATHNYHHDPKEELGYMGRMTYVQNLSMVTAACLMVKRTLWEEVEGLEEGLAVVFNDVDFCVKIREKKQLICFTPYAECYHYESISRGYDISPEKQKRNRKEKDFFVDKWKKILEQGDPYYHPYFALNQPPFTLNVNGHDWATLYKNTVQE